MSHSEVMKWFEYYFPDYAGERIDVFFPNGRNSIRIRQKNGQEFIFTYLLLLHSAQTIYFRLHPEYQNQSQCDSLDFNIMDLRSIQV